MQLIKCKTKLEKINRAKLLEELGTKDKKVFISLFKMNNKRLVQLGQIKVKFFFLNEQVLKPTSRPFNSYEKNLSLQFVPMCRYCGVFGHIKPKFHLLKQKV